MNRLMDRTLGKIADEVLSVWDRPALRQKRVTLKRMVKHRQAVLRTIDREKADAWYWKPVVWTRRGLAMVKRSCRKLRLLSRRAYDASGRGFDRIRSSAMMQALGRAMTASVSLGKRAMRAQAEAWHWLGRTLISPFRAKASKPLSISEAAPTGATMPDGLLAMIGCVACGHEVLGTNMKKYYKFRCPRCRAELLVIDPGRGLSMEIARGERRQSVVPKEKSETEESEPVKV